ncbi:MAG: glycolate oxidase subunit GlcE [Hyphomicrobiales bacterium]|nr:MAG: glycolate oxidase subunit GlcE [Hyphomicrobiales bacterium]
MTDTFKPRDQKDVADVVAWAIAEEKPLDVRGHGSKAGLGRPSQSAYTLDLSGLSGIAFYEPEELVLGAKAGTPLAEIVAALDEKGQMLAFEPMDFGPLYGVEPGKGTLGGTYAANVSGPRRLQAGAARDHALGIAGVSGRGEAFKSGGRVMKNVTGYDLTKGLAGSYGTLAVMTDITIKVVPKPETLATVVVPELAAETAARAMATAMGSPFEVSAAAHLPSAVVAGLDGVEEGRAATVLRLEGFGPSVSYRAGKLVELLKPFGNAYRLDEKASTALWAEIRDVRPFAGADERPLWRVSVAPTAGAGVVEAITRAVPGARAFYDWAGGLVWLELPLAGEAHADAVRGAIAVAGGGHATLIRADAATRAAVPVFQPQPAGLAALSARLKAQYDPHGILNPGRMVAGV